MIAGVASVGNGADTLHYAYRPGLNRLATATWRNSQNAELNSRTYAYDTYHRLTGINLNNVSEVTYTLNAKDQRTAASYAVGGAWSYSYDEKSQVTGATGNNTTYSYTYDGIGNRLTAAEGSNTWSYTSNLLNQYTAINSNQPTYDADGNMLTTGDGWLYTWNGENRLIRAENSDTLVEMAYDYMGRRIEKKVSSKGVLSFYSWSLEKHYKFAYDGYKLIAIYDAANNNALLMTFTWQPESVGLDVPVSMTCDGNTYYYVTDGNKNVTGLLDQAGTRVAEYVYGPFGQLLSAEGELADVNPFRFSSEYADDETGLVYYNYRYYSPQLGRWTKRDPIEEQGGVNLYKICNNNNINNFDVLGFFVIYIETVGWGHVGINLSGESYDFGRYAGRYKWSLYSGPNVLRKRLGLPNNTEKVTYHKYNFKVCKELEDAIAKYVRNIYSSLPRSFPQAVIDKLDAPRQLHANERYHGTDWAPNGWNCITFTFSSLTGGVRQIVNMRKTVSAEAKRQAKLIIQLNFRVSFSIGMDAVKATLESFKAANKRWVE